MTAPRPCQSPRWSLLQECQLRRRVDSEGRYGPQMELSRLLEAGFPLFQRLSGTDAVGLANHRTFATGIHGNHPSLPTWILLGSGPSAPPPTTGLRPARCVTLVLPPNQENPSPGTFGIAVSRTWRDTCFRRVLHHPVAAAARLRLLACARAGIAYLDPRTLRRGPKRQIGPELAQDEYDVTRISPARWPGATCPYLHVDVQ